MTNIKIQNMKLLAGLFFFMCLFINAESQNAGIGTATPNASAQLDITSNSKGFSLPLLSQSQRLAIPGPANGLLVYDTTTNRFYQFQDGAWRYIINSEVWARSSSRKFLYNTTDSVGIGTSVPQHRLDVNGDIEASNNITAAGTISAGGTASGALIIADGSISAASTAFISGNVNGGADLTIDNAAATLQFRNSGVNKTYFQLSGNDLRLGTNSGNANGKFILRMNGDNMLEADAFSNLSLIKYSPNPFQDFEYGQMVIGDKIVRSFNNGSNPNSLPVLYGRVLSDGFSPSMWPSSGSAERISTGVYEVDTGRPGLSAYAVVAVTATGTTVPRVCTGRYIGSGKFRVEIFSMAGTRTNNDFYFTITDALN
jgi:hypothetical protein